MWVSLTLETDMERVPGLPPHASPPSRRLAVLEAFRSRGIPTQATISPLLPLADPSSFARRLDAACDRVILDHHLIGDGSPGGWRTRRTGFPERLSSAGFGEWNELAKLHEVRDLLASVLARARAGRMRRIQCGGRPAAAGDDLTRPPGLPTNGKCLIFRQSGRMLFRLSGRSCHALDEVARHPTAREAPNFPGGRSGIGSARDGGQVAVVVDTIPGEIRPDLGLEQGSRGHASERTELHAKGCRLRGDDARKPC